MRFNLIILMLAIVVFVSIIGCGGGDQNESSGTHQIGPTLTPYKGDMSDPYRKSDYQIEECQEDVIEYTKRIEANPQDYDAYGGRAQWYACLKQHQLSINDYTVHIEGGSITGFIDEMAFWSRGQEYLELGQVRKAIDDFSWQIRAMPDDEWGYVSRAKAYRLIGETAKAEKDEAKACYLRPIRC